MKTLEMEVQDIETPNEDIIGRKIKINSIIKTVGIEKRSGGKCNGEDLGECGHRAW